MATDSRAAEIVAALARIGLVAAGERPHAEPLSGGVSSDIWRVDLAAGPVCVKRALARLKVAAVWEAPIERNAHEYAWLEVVGQRFPTLVPRLRGHDEFAQLFVMDYLDPARHPVWKAELAAARVDPHFAGAVGAALAGIHAATADDPGIARRFATDASFHALRLEPYLLATAACYESGPLASAEIAARLRALAAITAATRRVLVHGDVSPKNLLCGPRGPLFLDAECAWFGDPAFDIAFCLNHMLLKCLWVPQARGALRESFDALALSYLSGATWEPRAQLAARAAHLLPGLFLARIDGKSPVEYVTADEAKHRVRRAARDLLLAPRSTLAQVADHWWEQLA